MEAEVDARIMSIPQSSGWFDLRHNPQSWLGLAKSGDGKEYGLVLRILPNRVQYRKRGQCPHGHDKLMMRPSAQTWPVLNLLDTIRGLEKLVSTIAKILMKVQRRHDRQF